MKVKVNGKNLSNLIEKIEWSGDRSQAARKLSLTYCYPDKGSGIKRIAVNVGDKISMWTDKKKLLFSGVVVYVGKKESSPAVTVRANDYAWYLTRNKTFHVYEGMPDQITAAVCGEFGIPVKSLARLPAYVSVTSTGDKTVWQVIRQAYEAAGVQNIQIFMNGSTLSTEIPGSSMAAALDGNDDITDSSYTSSIENMINKVILLDKENHYLAEIGNGVQIEKYGSMQEVYKANESEDPLTGANAVYKGIEHTGSISAKNHNKCLTGKAITISKAGSNIKGRFTIISDKHSFSGSGDTMELALHFEEVL